MKCPLCQKKLELRELGPRHLYRRCFDHGIFVRASFFREFKGSAHITQDLYEARREPRKGRDQKIVCPDCGREMIHTLNKLGGTFEVDQCLKCDGVWLDVGEAEKLKKTGLVEEEFPQVNLREPSANIRHDTRPGIEIDRAVFNPVMLFGLPTEEDAEGVRRLPAGTILILLLSLALTFRGLRQPAFMERYIFLPEYPWREHGLTWLTSMLMHGSAWHWISNMYFTFLVGDNIEEKDGSLHLLLMFFVCALAAEVAYVKTGLTAPTLGASGGVAGLATYYALMFPRNRLNFFFFTLRGPSRVASIFSFKPIYILAMWLSLQIFSAIGQVYGVGNVNYIAHLAGAGMGAIFFLLRKPE